MKVADQPEYMSKRIAFAVCLPLASAQFDLQPYANTASVVKDFAHW